jgi:hypothetical protein
MTTGASNLKQLEAMRVILVPLTGGDHEKRPPTCSTNTTCGL